MRKSRPVDATKQAAHLEQKHQVLKARVHELDSRLHLSASEQVERQQLKKQKLAAKDALSQLRSTG
ncbi:MAG: YdcH family protein [Gammaproteobacteria bacterium]|nr:YdcH family protein [Gammaproteobacteria bacterium]NIR85988.1 YdcH family protein [Gammaproteobacteria bacterium]NIU07229.1 YdcH family protein [Gammaproteobacteria bacterium]NIV54032.1 DUF465 domain-containing protein [Gammaproteobacteria bacterium]NIX88502.1 DUF465 domain-containing protein [Gammaproteobacteria bacterium]